MRLAQYSISLFDVILNEAGLVGGSTIVIVAGDELSSLSRTETLTQALSHTVAESGLATGVGVQSFTVIVTFALLDVP